MYIDAQFRAAKLPARSPEPRFSGRPLASSLIVHGLLAAVVVVLAHRAILRAPEETPPIPMVFLPTEPAPVAPAAPAQAAPPAPQPPPPAKIEQPPPPPPPVTRVAPVPPPPAVVQESRPVPKPERPARLRRERHEPRIERRPVERRVPPRREPREVREPAPVPETDEPVAAEPAPVRRYAPAPPVESGPFIPPRPLSAAAGNRPPDYPSALQARGVQGLVLLRVYVTADGRAASVGIMRSSGSDRLDQSAASAVREWRFIPATRGGRPMPGVAEVPVNFQLSE